MAWETNEPAKATIKTPFNTYTVDADLPFEETVLSYARQDNMGSFRVFVGDIEIDNDNAPETFSAGQVVDIKSYDKAGL